MLIFWVILTLKGRTSRVSILCVAGPEREVKSC